MGMLLKSKGRLWWRLWYVDMKWSRQSGKTRGQSELEEGIAPNSEDVCVWKDCWEKVGQRRRQTWGASEMSGCICVRTETRRGSRGCASQSPGPAIPLGHASDLLSSARRRPRSAGKFNMLCVPAPPAPLRLHHHCPRVGRPLPASRSLLKAPLKPRWCLWIRHTAGHSRYHFHFRYVYSTSSGSFSCAYLKTNKRTRPLAMFVILLL